MAKPALDGVDTLSVNMQRLIEPPAELAEGEIRFNLSVEVATQDTERQLFGFIVSVEMLASEAVVEVRLGLRYSALPKVWDDACEEDRVAFIADVLMPDAYPYARSLVQISSGVLGTAPIVLPPFDPDVMKEGLHVKDQ